MKKKLGASDDKNIRTSLYREDLGPAIMDHLCYVQGRFPEVATRNDWYLRSRWWTTRALPLARSACVATGPSCSSGSRSAPTSARRHSPRWPRPAANWPTFRAGEQPAVVLVSIDPQRDTAARLAEYVRFFDPAFTGVTGEPDAIAAFTRELGVAVIVGEPDAAGQYTIDHTATLFLVGPDGSLAAIFGTPHSPDGIAGDYRRIVAHRAGGHR